MSTSANSFFVSQETNPMDPNLAQYTVGLESEAATNNNNNPDAVVGNFSECSQDGAARLRAEDIVYLPPLCITPHPLDWESDIPTNSASTDTATDTRTSTGTSNDYFSIGGVLSYMQHLRRKPASDERKTSLRSISEHILKQMHAEHKASRGRGPGRVREQKKGAVLTGFEKGVMAIVVGAAEESMEEYMKRTQRRRLQMRLLFKIERSKVLSLREVASQSTVELAREIQRLKTLKKEVNTLRYLIKEFELPNTAKVELTEELKKKYDAESPQ